MKKLLLVFSVFVFAPTTSQPKAGPWIGGTMLGGLAGFGIGRATSKNKQREVVYVDGNDQYTQDLQQENERLRQENERLKNKRNRNRTNY